MLPPMRPSPTIPICILNVLRSDLCKRLFGHIAEYGEARLNIPPDMRAQHAPMSFNKNAEITAGLSSLDDSKACVTSGNIEILLIIGGDLQKYAGIRPALIRLAGGMQEPRPKFQSRCD